MAKCVLSIELDNGDQVHEAGGTVSGVVHVHVDSNVKCNGLEIQSGWRTHGKGNVASDTVGKGTLFKGEWTAGESASYRFELPVAVWPPTYHGHYLNVDHYVDVRANIPWAFDPKSSIPFQVKSSHPSKLAGRLAVASERPSSHGRIVGGLLTGLFFVLMAGAFFDSFFVAIVILLLPAITLGIWFVRKILPKWMLGDVEAALDRETMSPGEMSDGSLRIQPKRAVEINGVHLHIRGVERVISGSGSNQQTHENDVFTQRLVLQESTRLRPGELHRFPFQVELPEDAPYSMELTSNHLIWSANVRVDIPKWPDWVAEIPIAVVPGSETSRDVAPRSAPDIHPVGSATDGAASAPVSRDGDSGLSFDEAVSHMWAARENHEQRDLLVEAIHGLTFPINAIVERRLLYAGDDDPHVFPDGYAVWARFPDPPLPLVLYVPHELADEFEQLGREQWSGRGTVVGWDRSHGRLQIRIDASS